MKATGLGRLQGYVKYVYWMHPHRVYYGAIVCLWMICVVYNLSTQVAHAAGGEIVAGETVAAHMSNKFLVNNNYIGVKRVAVPYLSNVEGYQHVELTTAFYAAGLHEDGWECLALRRNQSKGFRIPDAMITNGTEVITFEFKCTTGGNFDIDKHILYMQEYKK